eukprot:CAMPEP_0197460716 /NCGR_PEP_ID=MMETSP1175-20131217/54762_1 /TAXON_ID=1003142 /ORGANISM="Triceratium dubium, Strain CCMP147" /LENGTH=119 /DNA_ID=CAMNT_0042995865 /DNA_START=174 /DNA_END=529 /DNA_ORIENTATION=+
MRLAVAAAAILASASSAEAFVLNNPSYSPRPSFGLGSGRDGGCAASAAASGVRRTSVVVVGSSAGGNDEDAAMMGGEKDDVMGDLPERKYVPPEEDGEEGERGQGGQMFARMMEAAKAR